LTEAHEWDAIGPTVEAAAQAAAPNNPASARNLMRAITLYVLWRWRLGYPLDDPGALFDTATVHEFIAINPGKYPPASVNTIRGSLLRVCEAYHPELRRPVIGAKTVVSPAPYTELEVRRIRTWASSQTTEARRRDANTIVALGLGAGLASGDVEGLTTDDVHIDDDGICLEVGRHKRRSVTMLAYWEKPILDAVDALGPGQLLFAPNRTSTGKNFIVQFVKRCAPSATAVQMTRLRATWICRHLESGTPIDVLGPAAGLKPSGLDPYLAHLCERSTADQVAWLRFRQAPFEEQR